MSIIEKLFGSKVKRQKPVTTIVEPQNAIQTQQDIIPPINLFIDNEPPQVDQQSITVTQSKISGFLDCNFLSIGVNDGFQYHSWETFETGRKKIRAEFQLLIDKDIQEKSEKRLQLKMLIVNVEKISEETMQNLSLTIDELNSAINLLQKQKELSAESEGWVMNALHSYHQGYVQGMNSFIESEHFLNSFRTI